MKIIDIHSHVLPGIDDGSSGFKESLEMLKMAYNQGIYKVIATPHYSPEFQNDRPDLIRKLCVDLQQKAVSEIDSRIRIYPGQEIFYSENTIELLDKKKLLTLAGTRYVLIEFMCNVPYSTVYRAVRNMIMAQYRPVIAHIERYGVLREKGRVEELTEAGAYMQMNYRRIGGKWYEESTRWCRKMLKEEKIHFLGTDMHNVKNRQPRTQEAQSWIEKHLDMEYIKEISFRNAAEILKHKISEEKERKHGKYA